MFSLWLGQIELLTSHLLVAEASRVEFEYLRSEGAFGLKDIEVLYIADLDDRATIFLVEFINLKRGFLKWSDLPSKSFFRIWELFIGSIRGCNISQAKEIYKLIAENTPDVLERVPILCEFLLSWSHVSIPLFRRLAMVPIDGIISDIGNAIKDSRTQHLNRVIDLIDKICLRTDGDFRSISGFDAFDSFVSSLQVLYHSATEKRLIAQSSLMLALAKRESDQSNTPVALLCLHRCLELYFSRLLYQADLAICLRNGKLRYKEVLLVSQPKEGTRGSLLNSYYYCRQNSLVGNNENDAEVIVRINDIRNELNLTHGYSHPPKAEVLMLRKYVRDMLGRFEGDDKTLFKISDGFERWPGVQQALIWEISPTLCGYFKSPI